MELNNRQAATIESEQKRIMDAAMRQPMKIEAVAASAYINGILVSARIRALEQFLTTSPDLESLAQSPQERLAAIQLSTLTAMANQLEQAASKPRIALAGNG